MWTPDVQNSYTVVTETLQRRRRKVGGQVRMGLGCCPFSGGVCFSGHFLSGESVSV
jgi:hypothetical protein